MTAQTNFLNSIPDDVILHHLISRLSIQELQELCQTNTRFAIICENEILWRNLRQDQFPKSRKSPTLTERQSYRFLKQFKPFEQDREVRRSANYRYDRFKPDEDLIEHDEFSFYNFRTGRPYTDISSRLNRELQSPLPKHDEY